MFQWFYDFFMAYIMPMIASVMSFLGIDSKKVHFEDLSGGEAPKEDDRHEASERGAHVASAPSE
jgi:hypothetical protein